MRKTSMFARLGARLGGRWLLAVPLVAALVAPPVLAEGTRTLHPASGPGSTGHRGVMDLSTTNSAGVARQTQFTYVYAREGEVILLGSSNRTTNTGTNRGQIRLWAPQSFGTKGTETDPSNGSAVLTCDGSAGAGSGGLIANRNAELAGPNSADGTNTVPNGFTPCWYQVPAGGTGIYGVRFYRANSGGTNNASIANPLPHTSLVQAWDVTVRANQSSLTDLNGRVFTYVWAVYLSANNRFLHNSLHYVSDDGYRYRQTFQGLDPNRAVFYANPKGFIDGGAPLYKSVRGSNQNVSGGTSFDAGVTAERPTYPIFFSDVDPNGPNATEVNRVLTALAIPQVPLQPQLTVPTFVGNMGGHTSTVSSGGVFTFTTLNTLTYEIVVRRGAVNPGDDPNHPTGCIDNYDPANVCNRTMTGVALSGDHSVLWNGLDNSGNPFPIGSYNFQIVGRNGEIHFPMIDVENNTGGGPTLTKLNAFNTAEATTVYFDDRGHRTANSTLIGELNGHLCGATNNQVQPSPNHSLTGVDSSDANWSGSGNYYRYWSGSGNDPNSDCNNNANIYFGTAKGLDLWALERSPLFVEPVEIVPSVTGVDVGTVATMTPAVLPGETSYGNFAFSNAGDTTATGVTYGVTLGNPAIPATCPAAVTFTVVPAGVTATYHNASHPTTPCTITFTGMPTTLTPGQLLGFNFNYVVLASNPGPIPLDTEIQAANETNPPNTAPNTAHAETVVAKPVITYGKASNPAAGTVVNVGDTITYAVTVTVGNAPLTSDFNLVDTLDAGLAFGSVTNSSPQFNCSGSLSCTLPAGTGIGSYTVEYTATVNSSAAGSVANNVTGSGGGGDTPPACGGTCTTIHPLPTPALTLDKYVTSSGPYVAGDLIEYHFLVTNIGNVVLIGVHVDDPLVGGTVTCTPSTLNPGDSVVCGPATHSVSAGDVATGYVTNHATATGTAPDGSEPTAEDSEIVPTDAMPEIDLVKTVTSSGPYAVGDTINYQFVATNTGNVQLLDVVIDDPLSGLSALVCVPAAPATLDVGESMECSASYTVATGDVATGEVNNTATVIGDDPSGTTVTDDDSTTTPLPATPAIDLVKRVTSAGPYEAGDVITYYFDVTNTGNVALTNVHVTDPLLGGTIACTPNALAPSQAATCGPMNYSVTAADATTGTVNNTATAAGTPPGPPGTTPVTDNDTTTTPIGVNPALALEKSIISTGPYALGDTITYRFRVTNTGNVQLTGVEVDDPLLSATPIACMPSTLNPGESTYCGPVSYTVLDSDVTAGEVENTATAEGTPPGPPGTPPVTDDDTVTTPIQVPGLTVIKTAAAPGPYAVGEAITYSIVAENTGNVTLTGVSISDPGATLGTCTPLQPATLAPGETLTCPATYVVLAADALAGAYTNTATGTGQPPTPPGGPTPPPVTDDDDETVPVDQVPGLTVVKTAAAPGPYAVGATITYSIVATNTGDVQLTGVGISDPGATVGTCTPAQPATLAPGATLTCPATYVVQTADANAGQYSNTATGSGQPPTPPGGSTPPPVTDDDDETVPVDQNPGLEVVKTAAAPGPYAVGETITYSIVAENTGNVTLTGVGITDPGATVGTCTPAQPATLAPGATLTCAATYVVQTADANAGQYSNTATGSGQPPTPPGGSTPPPVTDNDDETVPVNQNPGLEVTKTASAPGPYAVGETITYNIVATNTGDVQLTGVSITDPGATVGTCTPLQPATLAPGATLICPATYVVQAVDAIAGEYTNTASGSGQPPTPPGGPTPPPVTDDDDETVPVEQVPGLTVAKTATAPGPYAVGDTITYSIVATNTGDVQLTGVSITDPGATIGTCIPAQPATLAPGATLTCAATYVVQTADANAGEYSNTATGSGQPPTPPGGPTPPPVTDDDDETVPVDQNPGLTVLKTANPGPYAVGDTITYSIVATNTGDVELTGVSITDPGATLGICTPAQPATLAPGATLTCAATYVVQTADANAGEYSNIATGTGQPPTPPGGPTPPPVTDEDDETVPVDQNPGLDVLKTATAPGPYAVGDTITYSIVATNTGDVELTGVSITDPGATIGTCTPAQPATLAPGAMLTCAATYIVQAADAIAGEYTNTASGSGQPPTPPGGPTPPPVTDDDDETVPVEQVPGLTVAKTAADPGPYAVGDTITYSIVAENTGDVELTDVSITDPGATIGICTPAQPATLAPGATLSCAATYVVQEADAAAGNYSNTATASGQPPTPPGGPIPPPVTGDDQEDVPVQNPGLTIVKSVTSAGPYTVGDTITYSFLVTNTGDTVLTDVEVNDPLVGLSAITCPGTTLAVGANMTCTATYVVQSADVSVGNVENTATAEGTPPGTPDNPNPPPIVSPPDDEDTEIQNPSLTIVKSVTSSGPYGAGDTINYQFVVTNTGNVVLNNVTVTDPLVGLSAIICPGTTLAVGANMTCSADYTVTPTDVDNGEVFNIATAEGTPPPTPTTPNPPPVSDDDDVTTQVDAPALTINKTGPATTAPGQQVVFTIVVGNTGPVAAQDVTVTDPTPAGLTFVSNAGDCTTAFPCDLGTLAVGETRTITVTMMVPASYSGPDEIINIATVSSSSTSDSHSSTATVPMRRPPPTLIPASSPWALLLMAMALGMLAWHQRGRMY